MKKCVIFLLLVLPFLAKAVTTYTCTTSGPWTSSVTWGGSGPPTSIDNVVIPNTFTVTVNASSGITNIIINSGGTLVMGSSGVTLTVTGNLSNAGTFSPGSGSTVIFGGGSNQNIGGAGTTTFDYLTISPSVGTVTVSLGQAITINNTFTISNGTFDSQTFQVTGSSGGNISMASGTTMLLGVATNVTSVAFPTGYTASGISLSSSSTVVYQANTSAQPISTIPLYGNLQIASNGPTTKTPSSSSSINIAGNLNISSTLTTFSLGTNTINLTGNATIQGTLAFSTGSFNIAGNFTNNGAYSAGTGLTTFNGSAAQTIGGSIPATFYDLTIAPSSSVTVTLGSNENIYDNLTISAGTLDVSASGSYSLSIGNKFIL
jgi:hypothetical protein